MTLPIASHPLDLPELAAIAKFSQFTATHMQRIPQTLFIAPSSTPMPSTSQPLLFVLL
jgi:hypothetical protein